METLRGVDVLYMYVFLNSATVGGECRLDGEEMNYI
jgi:hypothetical protein